MSETNRMNTDISCVDETIPGEGGTSRVAAGAMHTEGATMSHDGEIKTAVSRMPLPVLTVKNESAVSTAATHHEPQLSQVISRKACADAQVVSHMGDFCEPDSLQIVSQVQPEVDAHEHAENGSPVVVAPARATRKIARILLL